MALHLMGITIARKYLEERAASSPSVGAICATSLLDCTNLGVYRCRAGRTSMSQLRWASSGLGDAARRVGCVLPRTLVALRGRLSAADDAARGYVLQGVQELADDVSSTVKEHTMPQ